MKYIKNFLEFIIENKMTKEDFIKISSKKFNNLYDYKNVNFLGLSKPIRINCKKHGGFNKTPLEHLRGEGCPDCFKDDSIIKKLNQEAIDPITNTGDNPNTFYSKKPKLTPNMIRRN
jgi:hypothetical protein